MSPDPRDEEPLGRRVEARLGELLRESTLWPVWLVMVGHAAAFGAVVLLLGARDRNPAALAALALLVLGSLARGAARLREGRGPGPVEGLIAAVWILSAGTAWIAHRYGVF